MTTTISTAARAASLTVHTDIVPPHVLVAGDHPGIAEGDEFSADSALWQWNTYGGCRISLHSLSAPGVCLAYYPQDGDEIPEWLPRPPAEWDAAAASFIATVKAQP